MQKEDAGYIVDLDGTMYNGTAKIEEAADFVKRLRAANKPLLFLTNNSTSHPEDVVKKLKMVSDVEAYPEEIFTSTMATIAYLDKQENVKRVYVIGEAGLKDGLQEAGYELAEEDVDAVVVGLHRNVTYHDFEIATLLIQKGA